MIRIQLGLRGILAIVQVIYGLHGNFIGYYPSFCITIGILGGILLRRMPGEL